MTGMEVNAPHHIDDGLLERVRKLLTMAERTDNPAEADAFSRKAAELIARHRIDITDLQRHEPGDLVIEAVPLGRGAYVRARYHLLAGIADAHGCMATFMTMATGTVAHVTGYRSDVEVVRVLFTSLHQQMSVRASGERRSTPAATQRYRRSFMFGFAAQVAEMMSEAHKAAVEAHPERGSVLPVLADREARVKEFASERLGRIVTARPAAPAVRDGVAAGRRAAADADIGRTRINGRRAIGKGSG